jgi:cold-inducible RNA-binding protein
VYTWFDDWMDPRSCAVGLAHEPLLFMAFAMAVSDPSETPRGSCRRHERRQRSRVEVDEFAMGTRLYVGNLSFSTTEAVLESAFAQDGRQVSSVSVVLDRDTGRSRGFAFVEMANEKDAQAAIQALNGMEVDGRALRVNEAEERKPRSGGGGGGGGGRGGYGGGGGGGGGGGRRGGGDRDRW